MPHDITEADLLQVIEMVAEGHFLKEACERLSLPYYTVWRRINDDPNIRQVYQQANEAFGDARAYRVSQDIRDEPDPKRASVIATQERWLIESKARMGYGKVTRHEHAGEVQLNARPENELMVMLEQQLAVVGIPVDEFRALIASKRKPVIEGKVLSAPVAESPAQG